MRLGKAFVCSKTTLDASKQTGKGNVQNFKGKLFPTQNSKPSQTSNQLEGWDQDVFCTQVLKTWVSFVFSQS